MRKGGREERRLSRLLAGRRVSEEVEDELSFHLEMRARELEAAGMSSESARREALQRFGDVDRVGRECRRLGRERERVMRRTELVSELWQDIRFAVRQLGRARGFAVVAVLMLALGIGATTAIFSVVNGVLLRPLPYPGSERLVVPQSVKLESGARWGVTYADYEDWRREGVFAEVAVYRPRTVAVTGEGEPERLRSAVVTEDFFATLGVAPVLGRLPGPALFRPGAPAVVAISYELWQRRFGGDRGVVGRTIRLRGEPAEIVAVLPEGLGYPAEAELWVPFTQTAADDPGLLERDDYAYGALARLAPGATLEQARAALAAHARRIEAENPRERTGIMLDAVPLAEFVVGEELPRFLWIFLGSVGLVLLIGCVNVANLLLGRAAARAREFAIRGALGASRGRVVRQLLTESLTLGLLGGVAGVAVAVAGVRLLVAHAPTAVPRLESVSVDAAALGFALAASLLATLLFGLAPALHLSGGAHGGASPASTSLRTTTGLRGRRTRQALVAGELALSLVLLVGAGLLARSFLRLSATDPGFRTERLLTFSLALQGERYDGDGSVVPTIHEMLERVRAVPGVTSASAVSSLPIGGGGLYLGRAFLPEGRPEPPAGTEQRGLWVVATPEHHRTMGIPLVAGRGISPADDAASVPVMLVSRVFAERMFGSAAEALGKRVRSWRDENVYREVVGVVEDVRMFGAGDSIRPVVYVPHAQDEWSSMVVAARTAVEPASLAPRVRAAVHAVDPEVPLSSIQTMEQVFGESVASQRFGAAAMGLFALVALLLAAVGLYGVLSYLVAHRTREIGVRMALGARRGDVLRMVLGEALRVIAAGTVAGLAGAVALARLIQALLHEVSTTDPVVFVAVPLVLAAAALAASWIPARRAASVDPILTMRAE